MLKSIWPWSTRENRTSESEKRFQNALNNIDSSINKIDDIRNKLKLIKVDVDERLSSIPSVPPSRGENESEPRKIDIFIPVLKLGGGTPQAGSSGSG